MKARKKPRSPISSTGECRNSRAMRWQVELSDIAEGGCRVVDPAGRLAKGEQLRLSIAGTGPHHAQVCWHRNGAAGVEFVRPLPPELIKALRGQQAVGQPASIRYGRTDQDDGQAPGTAALRRVC